MTPRAESRHALFDVEDPVRKAATLSDCGTYRYRLSRTWDDSTPPVLFVGMNPSTADAEADDPTIRKCVKFARSWGYGELLMGNLFAFRSTDPKQLPSLAGPPYINPVGEMGEWNRGCREQINDTHLSDMARSAGLVVAAWGAIKPPLGWEYQSGHVRDLLGPMHALKLTKAGHPWHPLYMRDDTHPIPLPAHVHEWGPWRMGEQSIESRSCATCGAVEHD